MNQQPGTNSASAPLWAAYEQQTVAVDAAYQTYQKASRIAEVMFRQFCDAAQVRDDAQRMWARLTEERYRLYDAYQATQDRSVA